MFDTHVTVVGNVLTAPEWRRTSKTNSLVANFKVASTARRLDRENGRWVDGNSLRVRVNCWRKLAEGVAASVMVGDPIVVVGRLYTRDWTDAAGNQRTVYELDAVAVGHDLSRGRSRFTRNRPTLTTSTVEDADAENRVHGERTEPVPDDQAPARPGDLFDDPDPDFADLPVPPVSEDDALRALRGGGFAVARLDAADEVGDEASDADKPSEEVGGLGRLDGVDSVGPVGGVDAAGGLADVELAIEVAAVDQVTDGADAAVGEGSRPDGGEAHGGEAHGGDGDEVDDGSGAAAESTGRRPVRRRTRVPVPV